MKLRINREKSGGMMGAKLTLFAKVEPTAEESNVIKEFKMDKEIVWQAPPGVGAKYIGVKTMTVGSLMRGESHTCKSIHEIIELEEAIQQAGKGLKAMVDAAGSFGGEDVIDL